MLGYEINELIGKRMHSRIHHSHRDGSVVPVEIALAPINTAEGPQTLATVWDISERKRLDDLLRQRAQALETANRRLTQKNRELDEFAYIASHDLQAPLRGIVHLLEWVEEDLGDELGESVVHNMERMRGRVERMQLMIDDLLTYSRAGREEVQTEPVDTAEMISRVVQDLSLPAGFEVSCQESLPCFTTARTPLQTVFRNLIQNAVKHHDRDQGVVRIDCEGDGDWYTFTLSDDGPGIAAGQAERVFQIFQTLQPKDSHGGSGIGLAVSRRLVETGGGEIEVTAAGCDGRGCRFTFSWPVEWRAGGRLQR